MPSTYSNLGIELIGTGEQAGTWGTTTNSNFSSIIDNAIVGYTTVTVTGTSSGSPTVITVTDGAASAGQKRIIEATGSPASTGYLRIDPNDFAGYYFIKNSTGQTLIVFQGNYSSGRDVSIANGYEAIIRCDGGGTGAIVSFINYNLKTGNLAVGSNLTVTGTSTFTGNATFNGTLQAAGIGARVSPSSTIGVYTRSTTTTSGSYSLFCESSAGGNLFYVRGDGFVYAYGDATVAGNLTTSSSASINRTLVANVGCAVAATGTTSAHYSLYCYDSAGTTLFYTRADGGLFTNGSKTESPAGSGATTASAANMYVAAVAGNSQILRSTSSARYKNSIENASYGLSEVMQLRPVTYKGNNDGDKVFGGFIAEEVHAVGLTPFVVYDEQNRPDALAYGNMVSLLTKAIQEQQAMIEDLKARVAALGG
jgi:Chaperone of endosialidase